ncbi:hypothetical protein KEM48_009476, partial [Puccinia striiformis f. sp. tritici PST-130]
MVNLFLTTSFILRIAFLQATSPHGITFPEPPSAVHNLEAGQLRCTRSLAGNTAYA